MIINILRWYKREITRKVHRSGLTGYSRLDLVANAQTNKRQINHNHVVDAASIVNRFASSWRKTVYAEEAQCVLAWMTFHKLNTNFSIQVWVGWESTSSRNTLKTCFVFDFMSELWCVIGSLHCANQGSISYIIINKSYSSARIASAAGRTLRLCVFMYNVFLIFDIFLIDFCTCLQ